MHVPKVCIYVQTFSIIFVAVVHGDKFNIMHDNTSWNALGRNTACELLIRLKKTCLVLGHTNLAPRTSAWAPNADESHGKRIAKDDGGLKNCGTLERLVPEEWRLNYTKNKNIANKGRRAQTAVMGSVDTISRLVQLQGPGGYQEAKRKLREP